MVRTARTYWFDLARHEDPPVPPVPPVVPEPPVPPVPPVEDPLGEPGKRALEAEREARKAADKARQVAEAKVKEFEDRDKTEQQKLTDRADAAEKAAADANEALLRAQVAIEKGLPPTLASRLQGTTRDAMVADADALLALIPAAPVPPPPPGAAGVGTQGTPPAPANFRDADKADVQAELRKYGVRLP